MRKARDREKPKNMKKICKAFNFAANGSDKGGREEERRDAYVLLEDGEDTEG